MNKPGPEVIWLKAHTEDFPGQDHTVLLRPQGSVAVRVVGGDAPTAAAYLSLVKANLESLRSQLATTAQATEIQHPSVRVRAEAPDDVDVARLIAKIGFNLLVHDQGNALCRDQCFDDICTFVRTGAPERGFGVWGGDEGLAPLMRTRFAGQHWMMLAPMPDPHGGLNGRVGLAFVCSLYGGAARLMLLADDVPGALRDAHVIASVDYEKQLVERFDLVSLVGSMPDLIAEARRQLQS